MRLAVLSDIHGNSHALEAAVGDALTMGTERFLVLGDLYDGGPTPKVTHRILESITPLSVAGNHDMDLLGYQAGERPEWDRCCLYDSVKWTYRNLTPSMFSYLRGLPATARMDSGVGMGLMLFHGTPSDPLAPMPESAGEIGELARRHKVRILLGGHTHVQRMAETGVGWFINPGSVGSARSGLAEYALLTLGRSTVSWDAMAIPYDMEGHRKAFHDSGLLEQGGICARLNLLSTGSGTDHYFPFMHFALGYAGERGVCERSAIPDGMWWEAFGAWLRANQTQKGCLIPWLG